CWAKDIVWRSLTILFPNSLVVVVRGSHSGRRRLLFGPANRTTGYFHTHSVGGSDLGHGLVVAHRQPQARRRVGLRSRLLSIHRLARRYALLSSEVQAC